MTSHARFPLFRFARPSQAGFTLVELMIGLAIGMLATLVVMQVFSVFEAQKRTTTGAADAQTDGNIALYTVTRDLQLAGYGLVPQGVQATADSALECPSVMDFSAGSAVAGNLSPVSIIDGGSGNGGDSITIHYATSANGGLTTRIMDAVTSNDMKVKASIGCQGNDVALVMNTIATPMVCALTKVASGVPVANIITFKDGSTRTMLPTPAAVQGALIACLGTWNTVTYSVDPVKGNLLAKYGTADAIPIVAGIVNMQAQYGIADVLPSNDMDFNKITAWVDATGATWSSPTLVNRNRIKAVRIAIVARSATRAANVVSTACATVSGKLTGVCAWDPASTPQGSAAPSIDLSAGNADWDHYRYKVFESIIPLRSVVWARGTLP